MAQENHSSNQEESKAMQNHSGNQSQSGTSGPRYLKNGYYSKNYRSHGYSERVDVYRNSSGRYNSEDTATVNKYSEGASNSRFPDGENYDENRDVKAPSKDNSQSDMSNSRNITKKYHKESNRHYTQFGKQFDKRGGHNYYGCYYEETRKHYTDRNQQFKKYNSSGKNLNDRRDSSQSLASNNYEGSFSGGGQAVYPKSDVSRVASVNQQEKTLANGNPGVSTNTLHEGSTYSYKGRKEYNIDDFNSMTSGYSEEQNRETVTLDPSEESARGFSREKKEFNRHNLEYRTTYYAEEQNKESASAKTHEETSRDSYREKKEHNRPYFRSRTTNFHEQPNRETFKLESHDSASRGTNRGKRGYNRRSFDSRTSDYSEGSDTVLVRLEDETVEQQSSTRTVGYASKPLKVSKRGENRGQKKRGGYSTSTRDSKDYSHANYGYDYGNNDHNYAGSKKFKENAYFNKNKVDKPFRESSNDFDQREKLIYLLSNAKYECMVCCDNVKQSQGIWSCPSCFNVYHIGCIKKWASTAVMQGEGGWRCPACQTVRNKIPSGYYCFCSKVREPQWNHHDTPHSCGNLCSRPLGKSDGLCTHKCNILCHPGPCPPCTAQIQRTCSCGKTTKTIKCNDETESMFCTRKCSKMLNCLKHECAAFCHPDLCQPCEVTYELLCYCGSETKVVPCTEGVEESHKFECGNMCNKVLSCGKHKCAQSCHPDGCMGCPFLPEVVTHCPCGQTNLDKLYDQDISKRRSECSDPIPTCGKLCKKELGCGPYENPHLCEVKCHSGPCPKCSKVTEVRCRCKRNDVEVLCEEYKLGREVLCERKCYKKRHCGRHKCIQTCCIDTDHICTIVCGRLLSCGNHMCQELCHSGPCKKCLIASFEELTCHCGSTVTFPPIPCGARPPVCDKPCLRQRPCPHPPNHNCHPDDSCPPCTVLSERWCYGRHEIRKNVMCYLEGISCGMPCRKPLECGKHTCIRTCHEGDCLTSGQECSQPCPIPRALCEHPCGSPCHEGECPNTTCRMKVKVSCQCGQRKAVVSCEDQVSSYRKITTEHLYSKMSELNLGQTVSLESVLSKNKIDKTKSLKCDEECAKIERNRRLALALQIRNPELLPRPGAPAYSQFMKDFAKKDFKFVQMVHEKLTDLVKLAKVSHQRSRQHSFPVMNRDKRQFVHEYCDFFGCDSEAFDEEPNRNVVATAYGDRSWLPAQSIVDVYIKESGQKKIPQPPIGGMVPLSKRLPQSSRVLEPAPTPSTAVTGFSYSKLSDVVKGSPQPEPPEIDYFEMTE